VINSETAGKTADATCGLAKAANTGLALAAKFGSFFKGSLGTAGQMLQNEIGFIAAKCDLRLSEKWNDLMEVRRHDIFRPNFTLRLLTAAILEEDDELQDVWPKLLVNAGDASTEMEHRIAYVEILRGMSAFDVQVLSKLAGETKSWSLSPRPVIWSSKLAKSWASN
jgi:hypothetical protein